ncbi:unnamed protein product [Rodentolepis nana]|uniref:RPA_interact_N domain-containing protein n=1 Tax=Rodentolepis nana TaxID=102285 RepID=A0A0R3TDI7_RODNA|nr:unnamed protein product [Rodentolepis nana]
MAYLFSISPQDLFCINRDQQHQQPSSSPCTPPIYLHKDGVTGLVTRFSSSSCMFAETPLLQVPTRSPEKHSRARLPESWLSPDRWRRKKLCSWELERLQRLLEHSATGVSDDGVAVVAGGDIGGRVSSASTETTITTSSSREDLEERLSAQMAQRFSKMEL